MPEEAIGLGNTTKSLRFILRAGSNSIHLKMRLISFQSMPFIQLGVQLREDRPPRAAYLSASGSTRRLFFEFFAKSAA